MKSGTTFDEAISNMYTYTTEVYNNKVHCIKRFTHFLQNN